MSVSKQEIEKIAQLARLNLKEEEINTIEGQINQILEYVKKLDELDTENTEPLSHTLDMTNVFREDIVRESLPREKALENSPLKSDKFFRVPKVIKK
ncbi:MAG: Asp-tRNA(Asn)/Glu-tRNA(Gln) amidotransferase subunit GatC [Calditrichaceae bacterium]|jgi:aspartyl-tRNA(Asn)/glutamyl-tRNA(Gln) amidotransferase subunit C